MPARTQVDLPKTNLKDLEIGSKISRNEDMESR